MFFVYIIYSEKLNRFYIGSTDDVNRRLNEHNAVTYSDAFTSRGIPWALFLSIACQTSTQAYSIERHIKKMKSANFIQNLKRYPELIEKLKQSFDTLVRLR
jgi:putative endonuclease